MGIIFHIDCEDKLIFLLLQSDTERVMSTSGPIRKFEEGTPEYSNGKLLSTGKVFSVYRYEKSGRYVAVKSLNHPNSSGLILLIILLVVCVVVIIRYCVEKYREKRK